jgi:hypothetical protein
LPKTGEVARAALSHTERQYTFYFSGIKPL